MTAQSTLQIPVQIFELFIPSLLNLFQGKLFPCRPPVRAENSCIFYSWAVSTELWWKHLITASCLLIIVRLWASWTTAVICRNETTRSHQTSRGTKWYCGTGLIPTPKPTGVLCADVYIQQRWTLFDSEAHGLFVVSSRHFFSFPLLSRKINKSDLQSEAGNQR